MSIELIASNFSRQAPFYEQAARIQRVAAERLAARILKQVNNSSTGNILEIGCGTGLLSQHLLSHFPEHQIGFIDPAEDMLSQCRKNLQTSLNTQKKYNVNRHIFIKSTIENYLEDARFFNSQYIFIASSFVLHWLSDFISVIEQLLKRLERGGRLFFSFPIAGSFPEWQAICTDLKIPFTANQLPTLREVKLAIKLCNADIEYDQYTHQLDFQNSLHFFQEMKMLGAHTNKSLLSNRLTIANFRSLIRDWNNNLDEPLGMDRSKISCTYQILEGTITRR